MEKTRMRFPAQSCHETRRERDIRLALTARTHRAHGHHLAFGDPNPSAALIGVVPEEGHGPIIVGGRPEKAGGR